MSELGRAAGLPDGYAIYPQNVDRIIGMTFEGSNGKRRKITGQNVFYVEYKTEDGKHKVCLLETFDRWAKRKVE